MKSFRTDLAMKLDAEGEILICDGINIGLRIQNLTDGERLQLLPFLTRQLEKDFGKDFVIKQLVAVMNNLLSQGPKKPPPKIPVLATGKIKTQQIENSQTGVVTQETLEVELKDLAKMGKIGMEVRVRNLSTEELTGLLKLLERDIHKRK